MVFDSVAKNIEDSIYILHLYIVGCVRYVSRSKELGVVHFLRLILMLLVFDSV